MQPAPATPPSDTNGSLGAEANMFTLRNFINPTTTFSRHSLSPDTRSTPTGRAPLMQTFTVTENGLSERGRETIFTCTPPLHQEPAWRTPAETTRMIFAVQADDLKSLAEQLRHPSALAYLDAEDESGRSALDHALERKAFRTAHMLVQHGAKVADDDLLNPQLLINLMTTNEWTFAKQVARSRQSLVTRLDTLPPNDHVRMQQPLYTAILAGDVDMASLLWSPLGVHLRDGMGNTWLHYGAVSVNSRMLPFLLTQLPADPVQRQALLDATRLDGCTPLIQAALSNRSTAVAVLLRAGAALDGVDRRGESALHKAARMGMLEVGRLLLAGGARTDLLDLHQQTPLEVARASGRPDFVQLLEAFGVQA